MKKITATFLLFNFCIINGLYAAETQESLLDMAYQADFSADLQAIEFPDPTNNQTQTNDFFIAREPESNTKCATEVFARALQDNSDKISETSDEISVKQWIHETFAQPSVLQEVLRCPEFQNLSEEDSIRLLPISYNFPNGRNITISYETQPKILNQRIRIGTKRSLPSDDPNPRIGDINDDSIWVNIDPAWYAIMVVQAGSLDNFVGPDKNNTISLDYINKNIDKLYPRGLTCTSKSALANDNYMINRAVTETVGLEDDTNDYYIAGDVDLSWIGYAEVGLDVAITVLTMGTGGAILGTTKAVRASKTLKNLTTTIKNLSKTADVTEYIKVSNKLARAQDELKTIDKITDAARHAEKSTEIKNLTDSAKKLESADNVKKYKQAITSFAEINRYRHALRGIKIAQRGNIVARSARAFKAIRAIQTGNKAINKGARIARSSMKSGKIRDWLYHSTMRNIGKVGKVAETGGLIYGAINFLGGMYDFTETSTGNFTNNVEFSPLLLLSADDLSGQENVVNYGMWLMWAGDSMSAVDDDAAYLQAMDFAAKFHEDLDNIQSEENSYPCQVDIYVVRPVLRNPDTENAQIYYLIMNDQPWTTEI